MCCRRPALRMLVNVDIGSKKFKRRHLDYRRMASTTEKNISKSWTVYMYLWHLGGDPRTSSNQVKKPRRAEVNYYPDLPTGLSKENLEEERLALLSEVTKINNEQVEAEFTRITTVPLISRFMQQLDHHSSQLMKAFRKKGGAAGRRIKNRADIADLDKNDCVEVRRACVLKALIVYLNEDPENLIREYLDADDNQETMDQTILGVFAITKEGAEPTDSLEDVGIIIEGVEVLHDLHGVAKAVALLFGLMYSLDLSYPKNLRCTFEVLQKLVMELNDTKLSTKVQVLKNKLLEVV